MASLNTQPVSEVEVNFGPRIWTARVKLISSETLSVGASVSLDLGGYILTGYILRGSSHLGMASYVVSGGGGAWRLAISPPELRSDGYVRLYTVIDQILSAANAAASASGTFGAESLTITEPDRTLARAWVTRADTAATALDALALNWIVLPNGSTRLGPNPGGIVNAKNYAVQVYDPAHKWALLAPRSIADVPPIFDAIGGALSGDPFSAPFQYNNVKLMLAENALRIEVEG